MSISVTPVRRQTPSAKLAQGGGPTIIISLDAIRQEAGARWEKLRDTIYARLEALLRLRLSSNDFFLPLDETAYLVSMPKSTLEDAQVICLRIAYELHSSLLGPCSIQQLQIGSAFSIGDDMLEVTPIVSHQLIRLAERAQILDLLAAKEGESRTQVTAYAPRPPVDAAREAQQYQFVPIWDIQKQVIWSYRCKQLPSASMLTADTPSARAREATRLALGTLKRAALALEEHLTRGERFLVNVPIAYDTLTASIARTEYVSACRQLPCHLRTYLIFEISELPQGVPHSRLIDLAGSFQSFGRGVVAQVPLTIPQQALYEGAGLLGFGFALPQTARCLPALETERLCTLGKRLGISTFIDNVATEDALMAALDAGVNWLSGPVIAAPAAEPKAMSRLLRQTVLQNAAAAPPRHDYRRAW